MASPMFMRQRFAPAATGAVLAAGAALFPTTTLHAEAPNALESRKPIYDDFEVEPTPPANALPSSRETSPFTTTKASSPTPTDRLAVQIGKSRMFIYAHVAAGERKVNELMDSALDLEQSFTSTIASLAPSKQSGEKLMPGSIYVLVAAMTGSIISRNRNILLRGAVPLAVGIGAGWVVLPATMQNVSDLLWRYEKKFPVVADGHVRTREGIEKAWSMARIHLQQARTIADDKLGAGRELAEDWVKKGK